jgi:hypothetical protein
VEKSRNYVGKGKNGSKAFKGGGQIPPLSYLKCFFSAFFNDSALAILSI